MIARLGCVTAIALACACSKGKDDEGKQAAPRAARRPPPAPAKDPACSAILKALPTSKYRGPIGAAVRVVADAGHTWTRDCRPAPLDKLAEIVGGRLDKAGAAPVTRGPVVDRARQLQLLGPAPKYDRFADLARIARGPRGPMAPVALLLAADAPATRVAEITRAARPLCVTLVVGGARRAAMPRVWACGDAGRIPAEIANVSVLLDEGATWIGASVVDDRRQVADLAGLAEVLAEHKAGRRFAGRSDIEIAAKPGVPYSALIAAIDTAIAAGFVDVTVLPASALSASFEP